MQATITETALQELTIGSNADFTIPVAPTVHPLFTRLVDELGATWVDLDTIDTYLGQRDDIVTALLIAGDPIRFPEGLDVAVVLPELHALFPNQSRMAIATAKDEDAIAKRFAATSRPSLIMLRGDKYISTIIGILDWDDFVARYAEAMNAPTQRVPIAIANMSSGSSCA